MDQPNVDEVDSKSSPPRELDVSNTDRQNPSKSSIQEVELVGESNEVKDVSLSKDATARHISDHQAEPGSSPIVHLNGQPSHYGENHELVANPPERKAGNGTIDNCQNANDLDSLAQVISSQETDKRVAEEVNFRWDIKSSDVSVIKILGSRGQLRVIRHPGTGKAMVQRVRPIK